MRLCRLGGVDREQRARFAGIFGAAAAIGGGVEDAIEQLLPFLHQPMPLAALM